MKFREVSLTDLVPIISQKRHLSHEQSSTSQVQSHFIPVHVFLHFGTFGLEVLQLILASKLSELEHLENFSANNNIRKQKG